MNSNPDIFSEGTPSPFVERGIGGEVLARSRHYLAHEYPRKIRLAISGLTITDIWWRPNEYCNSIGNLLLHLAGNIRQWIVAGIGGATDERNRQSEFDTRKPVPTDILLKTLESATSDADQVLATLDDERLARSYKIQGRNTTGLEAVYHVIEHFSMHTGQIIYLAKMRGGRDLGFYEDAGGLATPHWEEMQ